MLLAMNGVGCGVICFYTLKMKCNMLMNHKDDNYDMGADVHQSEKQEKLMLIHKKEHKTPF